MHIDYNTVHMINKVSIQIAKLSSRFRHPTRSDFLTVLLFDHLTPMGPCKYQESGRKKDLSTKQKVNLSKTDDIITINTLIL